MVYTNLNFYRGNTTSQPDKMYIYEYHSLRKDYNFLEKNHNFIQWLFPNKEMGVNRFAVTFSNGEIAAFKQNTTAMVRLMKSFTMMLDFYGFRLTHDNDIVKSVDWNKRFTNLIEKPHNNQRITRILKCLGLLGLHKLAQAWVYVLIVECRNGNLPLEHSIRNYFIPNTRFPN